MRQNHLTDSTKGNDNSEDIDFKTEVYYKINDEFY